MKSKGATFVTPRRELLGIPERVTGRGVRIAIVDALFPAHPDLLPTLTRKILWADAHCDPFDAAEIEENNPGRGQHGLGRAAVAGGSGQSSGGQYSGVAPESYLILLNGNVRAGKYTASPDAIVALPEILMDHVRRLGVRAVVFGSAGDRTGPLVPWQWDRQRRVCERLSAQSVLVVSGTGNCPGSFSPTSLAPSCLAGGGLELPEQPGHPVRKSHSPEGLSFEGKAVPEYRVPAERIVVPSISPDEVSGVSGIPAGHTVLEGMSFGDPFMLGLLACVWQEYPELNARMIRKAVIRAARSASPRFGRHQVGMPTWDGLTQAVESLRNHEINEPIPFERYNEVQEMSWEERMKAIRSRPAEAPGILLNALPGPVLEEYAQDLVKLYPRCGSSRCRAAIVLLLALGGNKETTGNPLLDEALEDKSPLVLGCALDVIRRRTLLAENRQAQLARLINHPDGQVRYEALLAAAAIPSEMLVRPAIEGMERDLSDGPLAAFFARRTLLKQITGETCWPEARQMLPGECVYSQYWMKKQRECAINWRKWLSNQA